MAFNQVATQRRTGADGRFIGLAYEGCLPVLELRLAQWQRQLGHDAADELGLEGIGVAELLDDVQMIEAGMLGAQREALDRANAQRQGPPADAEGELE